MALTQSPSIVRNGLIFYYDSSNTQKSWKGKPSTNLIVYSEAFDQSLNWSYVDCSVTKTTSVTAPDNSKNAYAFYGNSNNNYHTVYQNYSYVSGLTYTQSIYVKSARYTSAYMQFAPAAFGSWIGVTFNLITGTCNSPGTITNVGNGWFRCSVTATATANASSAAVYFYASNVQYVGTGSANDPDIYIFGGQLEESSFPTPYIKTTTGQASRSTTQAVLDLTKNYTTTANNLVYNSDGTFSFNGSTSNLDAPAPNVGDFTIEIIAKWTASLSDVFACGTGAIGDGLTGGTYIQTYIQSTGIYTNLYSPQVLGGGWKTGTLVSGSFSTNTTYHITVVNSGTSWYYYSNGVYLGTYNHTYLANTGSTRTGIFRNHVQNIGNAGYVYAYRQYNRALTATEVLQNFNAQRDRYGI